MTQLKGKLALITGASRGIGAAIARRYAAEGAQLILAARTVKDLEAVDDEIKSKNPDAQVTLVPIDLTQPAQIQEMIVSIANRFQKLDILVGNAGLLGTLGPIAHQPPEDWEAVMDVNVTANWYLLHFADALLQKADSGRAIFVTSGVAEKVMPYWGVYGVSKYALEYLVQSYALENKTTTVKANLVSPGCIRTGMRAKAAPGEDPMTLPPPDEIMDIFVQLAHPDLKETGQIFQPL